MNTKELVAAGQLATASKCWCLAQGPHRAVNQGVGGLELGAAGRLARRSPFGPAAARSSSGPAAAGVLHRARLQAGSHLRVARAGVAVAALPAGRELALADEVREALEIKARCRARGDALGAGEGLGHGGLAERARGGAHRACCAPLAVCRAAAARGPGPGALLVVITGPWAGCGWLVAATGPRAGRLTLGARRSTRSVHRRLYEDDG